MRGFVNETDLQRLDPSRGADFIADELSIPRLKLESFEVSDFSIDRLPDGYLARPNGGTIAVSSPEPGDLLVAGVWYPVSGRPQIDGGADWLVDDRVQRGVIVMHSKPQSCISGRKQNCKGRNPRAGILINSVFCYMG